MSKKHLDAVDFVEIEQNVADIEEPVIEGYKAERTIQLVWKRPLNGRVLVKNEKGEFFLATVAEENGEQIVEADVDLVSPASVLDHLKKVIPNHKRLEELIWTEGLVSQEEVDRLTDRLLVSIVLDILVKHVKNTL